MNAHHGLKVQIILCETRLCSCNTPRQFQGGHKRCIKVASKAR